MADCLRVEVQGLKELERKMIALGPRLARNALRSSLNAGAQVIKKEAQAREPELTGKLKKATYVARSRRGSGPDTDNLGFKETYIVGVRSGRKEMKKGRDAYYWRWLEFGTKFMSARPFLRPAFELKKYEALERIKEKLFQRLEVLIK